MLAILIFVALVTNTHVDPIADEWLNRVGFAINDLCYLRLERLFLSALVTSGVKGFLTGALFLSHSLLVWLSG